MASLMSEQIHSFIHFFFSWGIHEERERGGERERESECVSESEREREKERERGFAKKVLDAGLC